MTEKTNSTDFFSVDTDVSVLWLFCGSLFIFIERVKKKISLQLCEVFPV